MSNTGTRLRYTLTLASGMLECLCFSGVIFGYATLVFVLKEDGYFSHLCPSVPDGNSTLNSTGEFSSDDICEDKRTLLKNCNANQKEKKLQTPTMAESLLSIEHYALCIIQKSKKVAHPSLVQKYPSTKSQHLWNPLSCFLSSFQAVANRMHNSPWYSPLPLFSTTSFPWLMASSWIGLALWWPDCWECKFFRETVAK